MLSYTQKAGSIELWLSRQQLQETFAQVHSDPCASDWVNVNMSLSKFAQVQTGSNANWWEASQENCPWTTSFHHCGQSSVYVHSTHDALPLPVAAELKMIEETHAGILASHFPTRSVYNSFIQTILVREEVQCCALLLPWMLYLCCLWWDRTKTESSNSSFWPLGSRELVLTSCKMPQTKCGNWYVIVFMDCLTKWVEAFAAEDQTSETIARLLVDHIVCHHGVPVELLSNRGTNLVSKMSAHYILRKINTTAYHPQSGRLVENFNWTLQSVLAKHAKQSATGSLCISSQTTLLFGSILSLSCLWSGSSHSTESAFSMPTSCTVPRWLGRLLYRANIRVDNCLAFCSTEYH